MRETEPLQFDIAVTGGTDDFFGAEGEVTLLDITPVDDDPEAATVTLYKVNIDQGVSPNCALVTA